MRRISEKTKILYLIFLVVFILIVGFLWLDYIGFINLEKITGTYYKEEAPSVLEAKDDEPSLIEREEFEKEKQKFLERVEELDKREMQIIEKEKAIEARREKLEEVKSGLDLEKKKLEAEKMRYAGYMRNVRDLAQKIESMRPEEAVEIMVKWEEPLIIDVLRQMDANAEEAGRTSITSYLISLMPREKASRIMYLMTQL
jgi:flagellar protein FlbB